MTPPGRRWLHGLLAAAALAGATIAAAADIDDCNAPAFQRVEYAAPAIDARAIWLGERVLRWPGKAADAGRFRLVHTEHTSGAGAAHRRGRDTGITLHMLADGPPAALATRWPHLREGVTLALPSSLQSARLKQWHRGALLLVHESATGEVLDTTALQPAAALDELYAAAGQLDDLGVGVAAGRTRFRLWAPTARRVTLCLYAGADGPVQAAWPMRRDEATGSWWLQHRGDLSGRSYTYLVDVFVRGTGWVRNRVTDPYSVALTTDSLRSVVADLHAPALEPPGWRETPSPHARAPAATDMVIYELHVRDFSIGDASVRPDYRGKYLAFTEPGSDGMRHLRALSQAGLTDVHLLPVFDIASIPEAGCITPQIPAAAPDSDAQQAAARAQAAQDCFNWGYDPFHFNAAEGSYATRGADGLARIVEFRRMVQALHRAGLRVGMDVVYNHTAASGQHAKSVLDRIVPGYYQRYDARGEVERSTCCDNTATEHLMMGKLLVDSVLLWARHYRIDSFRFDLMGHQPRALMEQAQARLRQALGREIHFIGEGWNFGEVANNSRFRQASQLELNGSGIGTFSDRGRDAVRGGGHDDSAERLVSRQGWLNGLHHDPNALGGAATREQLLQAADLVRVALAGSLREVTMLTHDGQVRRLEQIAYGNQPAGYASAPGEVVNYVDNHDNQTLFDINALRLPRGTSREDRARVQVLGMAVTAFSQGVAYFHAGVETLRSKSLDRNSYDSGDWFNRLDWTFTDNGFGAGLPPRDENGASWAVMKPFLADPSIKPISAEIAWTRDAFLDLLRIRASTTLLRLRSAREVRERLRLLGTGPGQVPTVVAAHLDGRGHTGAVFGDLVYLINVDKAEQRITAPALAGRDFTLHPVHLATSAADKRPARSARFDPVRAEFTVPPRTAVVFVAR